jgi:hypothetical protein
MPPAVVVLVGVLAAGLYLPGLGALPFANKGEPREARRTPPYR